MVKFNFKGKEYYLDGYIQKVLDRFIELKHKDWDMVSIVSGSERAGKSVLAQRLAAYLDPNFNLDNIVFTADQFTEVVMKSKPGTAIVFDEAYGGLNALNVLSKVSKALNKMMTEIGKKNLYIFIVLPAFFDLNKYIAIWRTRALFHVYHDNFERGRVLFFDEERKKSLYIKGKKYYSYTCVKANFAASFTDGYMVDRTTYEEKKEKGCMENEEDELTVRGKVPARLQWYRDILGSMALILHKENNYSYEEISKGLGKYLPSNDEIPTRKGVNTWALDVLRLARVKHKYDNLLDGDENDALHDGKKTLHNKEKKEVN